MIPPLHVMPPYPFPRFFPPFSQVFPKSLPPLTFAYVLLFLAPFFSFLFSFPRCGSSYPCQCRTIGFISFPFIPPGSGNSVILCSGFYLPSEIFLRSRGQYESPSPSPVYILRQALPENILLTPLNSFLSIRVFFSFLQVYDFTISPSCLLYIMARSADNSPSSK